jgi:4-hydroxy-tetrahydrodipicolinate synthase
MNPFPPLTGVFAAIITPLLENFQPDLENLAPLLSFMAQRGCHGALVLGTTGEGPSFSPAQRQAILAAAVQVRQVHPRFRLLAGTGTPSLDETIQLTRAAFNLGYDGVVTLPPYYFRQAKEDGLFTWFSQVIRQAVPSGGACLGYHIPSLSGVALSLDLIARLRDAFPNQFYGIKDSSGDPETARRLGQRFNHDLLALNGNDSLFSLALENHAGGCITAMANIGSPGLRRVWESFTAASPGAEPHAAAAAAAVRQAQLDAARALMDAYPPNPPLYKALLRRMFDWPRWAVCPPLTNLDDAQVEHIFSRLMAIAPEVAQSV